MKHLMFVGSCNREIPFFANAHGRGISVCCFDAETGDCDLLTEYGAIENPTYLTVSQGADRMYANSELFGWPQGLVSTLAYDAKTQRVTHLDMHPSRGSITSYSSITNDGRFLLVANYQDGHDGPDKLIAVFPILENGVLGRPTCELTHTGSGPNPERQERSHAHFIAQLPNGNVVVADLGMDKIIIYRLTEEGALFHVCEVAVPPGSGPRHLTWNHDASLLFVCNELASTISTISFDQIGFRLELLSAIPTTHSEVENRCSGILISADTKYIYLANRGEDSVVAFEVGDKGRLTEIDVQPSGGQTPRDIVLSPCEKWLLCANQDSDGIELFRRDPQSGRLENTGKMMKIDVPMCIKFASYAPP